MIHFKKRVCYLFYKKYLLAFLFAIVASSKLFAAVGAPLCVNALILPSARALYSTVSLRPDHLNELKMLLKKQFFYDSETADFNSIPLHLDQIASFKTPDKYWVAEDERDGAIIGGVGLYQDSSDDQSVRWLDWFAVSSKYQGLGVGGHLIEKAIEEAQQLQLSEIRLYTTDRPEEASAQLLYEKYHFLIYHKEPELRRGVATGATLLFRKKTILEN